MVRIKIAIEPYVAEYIRGKYYDEEAECVIFPPGLDIYIQIYDLLQKRPASASIDTGNLEFGLPDRRDANRGGGKNPETYNYLSQRSARMLGEKMRLMMWAEVHDFFDENKHAHGIQFKDSAYQFLTKYCIESISDDGLLKNYRRWRDKCRRNMKRGYVRRKD